MKKTFLFLVFLLAGVFWAHAATEKKLTWSITGVKTATKSGGSTVDTDLEPSSSSDGTWHASCSSSYAATSSSVAQLGSAKYPFSGTLTLNSHSIPTGATITGFSMTVSKTTGAYTWKLCDDATNTISFEKDITSATTASANVSIPVTSDLKIVLTATSAAKAIYISEITITYTVSDSTESGSGDGDGSGDGSGETGGDSSGETGGTTDQATEGTLLYTCQFGTKYNSSGVSSYSNSWSTTVDGTKWNITNANNNNNSSSWSYVKIGAKGSSANPVTTTATITNDAAFTQAIGKIELNLGDLNTSATATITLKMADNSSFTDATTLDSITAVGNSVNTITIPKPAANQYYQISIEVVNKSSSNGALVLNSIKYYQGSVKNDLTSLAFANDGLAVNVGEEIDMPALVVDPSDVDLSGVTYAVTDGEAYAEITSDGKIKGLAEGSATITATFPGNDAYRDKTATLTVTVSDASKKDLTLSFATPASTELGVLARMEMPAITLSDTSVGTDDVQYSSSDEAIAKIVTDEAGKIWIEAVAVGSASIKAELAASDTHKAASDAFTITVVDNRTEPTLAFSGVTDGKAVAQPGKWDEFVAPTLTGVPDGQSVTYASSKTEVATVDEATGAVTIVGAGTTTITATLAESASYKAATASYTLSAQKPVIAIIGKTYSYTGDGETVKVNGGSSSYVSGTVTSDIADITLDAVYSKDGEEVFRVKTSTSITVTPKPGYTITGIKALMKSGNSSNLTIDGTSWTASQNYIVEATDLSLNKEFKITVGSSYTHFYYIEFTYSYKELAPLTKFEFSGLDSEGTYTILLGNTENMPAIEAAGEQGDVALTGNVTYSISQESEVASISDDGSTITAKALGTATVYAQFNGDTTYKPRDEKASFTLVVKEKSTFTAFAFANAEDLTVDAGKEIAIPEITITGEAGDFDQSLITYSVANAEGTVGDAPVAEIVETTDDETGAVTRTVKGLRGGSAVVTATYPEDKLYQKQTATFTVTVEDSRTTVALSFGVETFEINAENWKNFTSPTVVITPEEVAENITNIVYSIDDEDVATIDAATGALTPQKKGTATVTATYEGSEDYYPASASYALTVDDGSQDYTWACSTDNSYNPAVTNLKKAEATYALNGKDWTVNYNSGSSSYYLQRNGTGSDLNGASANYTYGSKTNTIKSIVYSTDEFSAYQVSGIKVYSSWSGSSSDGGSVEISVTVGDTEFTGTNTSISGGTVTESVFSGLDSGKVTITWATSDQENGVGKQLAIYGIVVSYREEFGRVKVVIFDPKGGSIDQYSTVALATETEGATIHYRYQGEESWTDGEEGQNSLELTITTPGDVTLEAYATYADLEASKTNTATFNVVSYEVASAAEFLSKADTKTAYTIIGELAVLYINGKDMIVADNSADGPKTLLIDGSDKDAFNDFKVGDVITNVKGTYQNNSGTVVLSPADIADFKVVSDATALEPSPLTYSDLTTFTTTETRNAYSLGWPVAPESINTLVYVKSISSTYITIVDDNEKDIQLWNRYNSESNYTTVVTAPTVGKWYNVEGLYWNYGNGTGKTPVIVPTKIVEALSPVTFSPESGSSVAKGATIEMDCDGQYSALQVTVTAQGAESGTTTTIEKPAEGKPSITLPDELGTYTVEAIAIAQSDAEPNSHVATATFSIAVPADVVVKYNGNVVTDEVVEVTVDEYVTFYSEGATEIYAAIDSETEFVKVADGDTYEVTYESYCMHEFYVYGANSNGRSANNSYIMIGWNSKPVESITATNVATGDTYSSYGYAAVATGTKIEIKAPNASQIKDNDALVAYGDTYILKVTGTGTHVFTATNDVEGTATFTLYITEPSVDVTDYNPTVSGGTWKLVTSLSDISDGDYVALAGSTNYNSYVLSVDGSSALDATISDDELTAVDGMAILKVANLSTDDQTLNLQIGDYYLGYNSANNMGFTDSEISILYDSYNNAFTSYNYIYVYRDDNKNYIFGFGEYSSATSATSTSGPARLYVLSDGTATEPTVTTPDQPDVEETVTVTTTDGTAAESFETELGDGKVMEVVNGQFKINDLTYSVVPPTGGLKLGKVVTDFAQVADGSEGAGTSAPSGRMYLVMDDADPICAVVINPDDVIKEVTAETNTAAYAVSNVTVETMPLGSDNTAVKIDQVAVPGVKVKFADAETYDGAVKLDCYDNDAYVAEEPTPGTDYQIYGRVDNLNVDYTFDSEDLKFDVGSQTLNVTAKEQAKPQPGLVTIAPEFEAKTVANESGTYDVLIPIVLTWTNVENVNDNLDLFAGCYFGVSAAIKGTDTNLATIADSETFTDYPLVDGYGTTYKALGDGDSWAAENNWSRIAVTSECVPVLVKTGLDEATLNDTELTLQFEVLRYSSTVATMSIAESGKPASAPRRVTDLAADASAASAIGEVAVETVMPRTATTQTVKVSDLVENGLSGIYTITGDEANDDSDLYNLQGVKVGSDNLAPGLYIRRQGNTATKVLIK